MVTPIFELNERGRVSPARAPRADGECLRYRLDVVATSAVDVVQSAGGWLYDRVMAGWEVTVLLPRGCDTRSLRILGVAVSDLQAGLDPTARGEPQPGRQRRGIHRGLARSRQGAQVP